MNFPQPGPFASTVPGHPCPGMAEEAVHSFMCEGTLGGNGWKRPRKDIPSLAGKWPARLAGDGLLSVPVAGRDSSGPAWKKKMSVCVLFFPLPSLSLEGAGGCKSCTWLVRARRWCRAAPALVGVAVFARMVFPPRVFALCVFSSGWVGYLGRGGRKRPRGKGLRAARDGWICFGMTGYHTGFLKGKVCCNP